VLPRYRNLSFISRISILHFFICSIFFLRRFPQVKLPKRFYFPHPPEAFFADTFNAIPDWESRWHAVPESSTKGAWKVESGSQTTGVAGDLGLITSMPNKHHAIFTLFDQPWDVTDKPYVIQCGLLCCT
jgi:hypothetical protein